MTQAILRAAFALSSFATVPAFAQTIGGCGAAIPKVDATNATKLQAGIDCRMRAFAVENEGITPRRARLAAIALVSAPIPASTPVPPPAVPMANTGGAPTTRIGINVSGSSYYGSERIYANLVQGSGKWSGTNIVWNRAGYPVSDSRIYLAIPQALWSRQPVKVTCTWKGAGSINIDGNRQGEKYGNHTVSVTWKLSANGGPGSMFLNFSKGNAADPLRDLDCREAGVVSNGVFDQRFVDDMKPYKVLRFLDWSYTNGDTKGVAWATRTQPNLIGRTGSDGVAVEHQVDLANLTGADIWFTIPWNADETYVRNFATLVRDRLGKNQRAYFELSNEVWNFSFPAATQALNEGLAAKLSTDKYSNNLLRYAEKSIATHKILTEVFAGQSNRLVRVLGLQSGNAWALGVMFGFRDTKTWIDAVASAPYFGHGLLTNAKTKGVTDLPTLFAELEKGRISSIAQFAKLKAKADTYGKRSIIYESGQHVIAPDALPIVAQLERDPEMGRIYDRYLAGLKTAGADVIMIYSHTGGISRYGSWGIREYAGQPIGETPKRRAVLDAIDGR